MVTKMLPFHFFGALRSRILQNEIVALGSYDYLGFYGVMFLFAIFKVNGNIRDNIV